MHGTCHADAPAHAFLLPVCCIVACCSTLPLCYRSGPQPVDASGAGEGMPHRSSGQRICSSWSVASSIITTGHQACIRYRGPLRGRSRVHQVITAHMPRSFCC
jgi:hypothetical protein